MKVSVIGTGYVGLVTGACLASLGHKTVCVDRLTSRVNKISGGEAPFYEPGLDALVKKTIADGSLKATSDLQTAVKQTDISLIAVGTPDIGGRIDLSQIESAAADIGEALRTKPDYHVVAVKSTVVPGTTDGPVRRVLERAKPNSIGADIGLCMNPEFLREGTAINDFMNPDRVVIGAADARAAEFFAKLYDSFDCPQLIVSLRNAEFIKYSSNTLLATMISFSNELAALCEATPGADVETVLDGLHMDKRLSPIVAGERVSPGILSYLRPSSGYGGSCLPKDVAALRSFAREREVDTPLLDAVTTVNNSRAEAVLDLAESRIGAFADKRVGVLGLAFKSGTDDLRQSPAVQLVEQILRRGADATVYDPVATELARPIFGETVAYADGALEAVRNSDIAIIGTGWPQWHELDWVAVKRVMRGNVLLDARNSLRTLKLPSGFVRIQIGSGA